MRVTKRTNIAMRLLMFCAARPGHLATKSEIARCCQISENHLAQVVNQLGQLGYLSTHRGRNGGFALARPAQEITVGEVFRRIEGELPLAECFRDTEPACPLQPFCRLRPTLAEAAQAFYRHLDGITLASLVSENHQMAAFFRPDADAPRRPAIVAH